MFSKRKKTEKHKMREWGFSEVLSGNRDKGKKILNVADKMQSKMIENGTHYDFERERTKT